jgi:hypothetical protein
LAAGVDAVSPTCSAILAGAVKSTGLSWARLPPVVALSICDSGMAVGVRAMRGVDSAAPAMDEVAAVRPLRVGAERVGLATEGSAERPCDRWTPAICRGRADDGAESPSVVLKSVCTSVACVESLTGDGVDAACPVAVALTDIVGVAMARVLLDPAS